MISYIICNDEATLAYLNNLAANDMNVWTSNIWDLENPDYLVLHLDPYENNSFDYVLDVANVVKKILDTANVEGYPKNFRKFWNSYLYSDEYAVFF